MPNDLDPNQWFLPQDAYGYGTSLSQRDPPWDTDCKVTPFIGGYAAMGAIRDSLEAAMKVASGHVYMTGWRLDPLRDLSDSNQWGTNPLTAPGGKAWPSYVATSDQTVIGLLVRLIAAGLDVRILVWYPTAPTLEPHQDEHRYLYDLVQSANDNKPATARGSAIIGLDARIPKWVSSHHQKMMVIRSPGVNVASPGVNVAYCGGVDLAFTRRDAPAARTTPAPVTFNDGDWQSGNDMPAPGTWPQQAAVSYPTSAFTPKSPLKSDLPGSWVPYVDEHAQPSVQAYGDHAQLWHDQHLKLEGPVVATIEQQFIERWIDSAFPPDAAGNGFTSGAYNWPPFPVTFAGQPNVVFVSDASAVNPTNSALTPLPNPLPVPSVGSSLVQIWRTIPLRKRDPADLTRLFFDGEFSVLSGIANAISKSKELIWIFDQYFWSYALALQLRNKLADTPTLRLIIILPPFADDHFGWIHALRARAIAILLSDPNVANQVAIFNLWKGGAAGRGIYCHAKVQTYDGSLLVCGSANMNQRSMLSDTELDCAVLDPLVVRAHQVALWSLLFPAGPAMPLDAQTPAINLNTAGAGKVFFDAFTTAVANADPASSFLYPDPAFAPPIAPATPPWGNRPVSTAPLPCLRIALEPTSLHKTIGSDVPLDVIAVLLNDPNTRKIYRL
jgi:phosphatidylserine/phosphatidylglycerophosphate/cardiolipin synthase-like enzyme